MDSAAKSASSTILTVVDAIGSSFWQLVSGPLTSVSANLHRWLVANASSTLIHVPGANDLVDLYINQPLGLQDMTTARFLSTFFVAYGVMALVSLLPAKMPRHLLCLVSGVVLNQFVFGINYAYILLTSMVAYTILAVGQYVKPLRGWAHVISGCAVFGYLCVRQITRSGVSASSVDDSILQMVLTIKLYSLGYNLFDGTADAENIKAGISSAKAKLAKEPADRSAKAQLSMLLDRQARGLGSLPSVIPFLGYVFNPATLFSGPAFEYKDYATAMERDSLPGEAPSRYLPALWKFVIGLVHLAAAALLKSEYSPEKYVYQPAIAVLSKDPSAPSFFTRLLYMYITFWVVRSQYYGCWKLAEGACVMGGFGYRAPQQVKPNVLFADTEWMIGESTLRSVFRLVFGASYETRLAQFGVRLSSPATGSAHTIGDWEGASNVALATVETRRGPDELVRSWNVFTQSWLERYIFKRAPRAGGFNRWLTFLASAFWHGFYSGYYLVSRKSHAIPYPRLFALCTTSCVPPSYPCLPLI